MLAPSYKLATVLFGIGVTLHNLEEALFLADWARAHVKLWFEPNRRIYAVVTSLVTVVIWIPILGVCASNPYSQSVLSGFALVMAVNAFVPHLIVSVVKRSYCPGVGTGLLFNLPLGVWLIHAQLQDALAPTEVWRTAILYALLLSVGTLSILFAAHAILAARKR